MLAWILVLIFAAIAFVMSCKTLKWYIKCAAAWLYMEGKEYTLPTEIEEEACIDAATKHIARDVIEVIKRHKI